MTALMIVGAVILFLYWLLVTPVIVDFSYKDGEFGARLRYVVMRFDPLAKAAEEKKPAKQKKEKRPKKAQEAKKAATVKETVDMVRTILKGSRRGMQILRHHLIFSRVQVGIVVGGDDAHVIAESYGKLCAAVLAALDLVGVLFVLREPKLDIRPDFLATQSSYDITLRISIKPVHLLHAGISVLWKFLRTLQQNKKTKQQIKGGKTA